MSTTINYTIPCSLDNFKDKTIIQTLSREEDTSNFIKKCILEHITANNEEKPIENHRIEPSKPLSQEEQLQSLALIKQNQIKSLEVYQNFNNVFNNWTQHNALMSELKQLNEKFTITNELQNQLNLYYDFCSKTELIKFDFIDNLIKFSEINKLNIYDNKCTEILDDAINILIPKCNYNETTEVFNMDLTFVPYLNLNTIKGFSKMKNITTYLILEGIKQLKVKPKYDRKEVLIIFDLYSPYVFDVDNIEVKYIIDALRYAGFFHDDNCQYVSYMVQGHALKELPLMNIKIIKKDAIIFV